MHYKREFAGSTALLPTGRNLCRKTQKSSPRKISAAEKIRGRIFCRFAQKMAYKGPNFVEVWFSHKFLDTLKKKTVKSTGLPDFFSFYHAFRINSTCLYIRGCVRPNFFSSGRIFKVIWQKTFGWSWQHWVRVFLWGTIFFSSSKFRSKSGLLAGSYMWGNTVL
jgi:hypothetical protein